MTRFGRSFPIPHRPRPPGQLQPQPPPSPVVNQWSGTFAQSLTFGQTPSALQSTVIALTPGNSVGGGSGTPSAGNWLVLLAGWNQSSLPAVTMAASDDAHAFWRPGDVTKSTWAVSTSTGNTRTAIWYTANPLDAARKVYAAPSGLMAGMAVLVIEVSASPWDTVVGINTNYAAAATTLNLALGAPSAASFAIAAVCGDSSAAGQAFAPGGWTTLSTVTATNGTDHTCDAVLTSAILASTSSSISVNGTASSSTDLSGVVIEFLVTAPSPVPAANNANWPYVKFEAAFGGGFQTPPDQLTWTDLTSRLWSWDETTGVQYQLGQIQATDLDIEIDNFDNALASDYTGSPFYSSALNSNMSFQSGVSPWTGNNNAVIAQSSAFAYASSSGATAIYSLQMTPDGVTATPGANSEQVAISATGTYSASAWIYVAGGYATGANIAINWYNSSHTYISTTTPSPLAIPAATWTQVTNLAPSVPGTAAFAQVVPQLSGTPSAATVAYIAEAALVSGSSAVSTGLVTTGVPVRIRAAVGTLQGVTANRWYVLQRNAERWPQQIDSVYRRYVTMTATDIWSVMAASETTPYRGEVTQDAPYAWWAMDDQVLAGGVLPTTLRNIAPGNTNVMNIILSPNGAGPTTWYDIAGASVGYQTGVSLNGLSTYAVAQQQGWMYGDPQSVPPEFTTSSITTANPGAAAWQASGQLGNGGANGYFLSVNDTNFPVLANGITVEGWFNYEFFGSQNTGTIPVNVTVVLAQQPDCPLTILALTTASLPVCFLQLDTGGSLSLITYNGSTPTSHSIYNTTDLRDNAWHHYAITLTTSNWHVYVDGGQTASVSGTGAGMTSAWSWLLVNADMGVHGGGNTATIGHGGNVLASHVAVYPSVLPAWRIIAHYWSAMTAFGQIPAPSNFAATIIAVGSAAGTPDGQNFNSANGYGSQGAGNFQFWSMSALAEAVAGSFHSGPSAYAVTGEFPGGSFAANIGDGVYLAWTGVAPSFVIYNSAAAGAEKSAVASVSNSDVMQDGYGAGATAYGIGNKSTTTGNSPPAASSLGDTPGQRIERCLSYGKVTYPGRSIDPATLLVQAATDIGGQQTATNITNIVRSDGGLLYIDNLGNMHYDDKVQLAAEPAQNAWTIGPATSPYYPQIKWLADPQRVWNAIAITPFSPEQLTLANIGPTSAASVQASQLQYGPQPLQFFSYLQSQSEMQTHANWLFTNFGTIHVRAENVRLDAAPAPGLWPVILGMNVGDPASIQMWQIAGGGITWTMRISRIRRRIEFTEKAVEASVVLDLDWEPSSYWA